MSEKEEQIIIPRPEEYEAKLSKFKAGGGSLLQVIADFDQTLTRFRVNNQRGLSSHGIVENSGVLSEEYHEVAQGLYKKYYPMEVDPSIGHEEKVKLMVEWWDQAHEAIMKSGIKKNDIQEMVKRANTAFRDGCVDFFATLNEKSIPILIFSAGLGNVLQEVIVQRAQFYDNMNIISNWMEFDDATGDIKGFRGENIHVLNKNEFAVANSKVADDIHKRKHVILLGDSLGDLKMSDGSFYEEIIRIGFLNDRIDERLETYKDSFDIVIVNDGSFNKVNGILHSIA